MFILTNINKNRQTGCVCRRVDVKKQAVLALRRGWLERAIIPSRLSVTKYHTARKKTFLTGQLAVSEGTRLEIYRHLLPQSRFAMFAVELASAIGGYPQAVLRNEC